MSDTEENPKKAKPKRPVTPAGLLKKKKNGEKITILTAYDYPFARLADSAGIDCLLVSDVLGQVGLGYESTVPVTLEEIAHHTKAVKRGVATAFVIAKVPFLLASMSAEEVLKAAGVLVKEAGAQAVEIEGGAEMLPIIETLITAGIPVMPHIGLTAQHFLRTGSFGIQGKTAKNADKLIDLAVELEKVGVFAIMLECVTSDLAEMMAERLSIPVIGIGSGPACDGQILVPQDMLGLFDRFVPKFVKVYRQMGEEITSVFKEFIQDVETGFFPGADHTYFMEPEEAKRFRDI